jgi:hypothetical protein
MGEPDFSIFSALFREAYLRCFKQLLSQPLTETESKLFHQQVLDCTGLTVGWRSLKNYSFFVLDNSRNENPSIASMDTLARYVLQAPYTNEIARKDQESHHPYWFLYREKQLSAKPGKKPGTRKVLWLIPLIGLAMLLTYAWLRHDNKVHINEEFRDLSEAGLHARGWYVKNADNIYWTMRSATQRALTLFTLAGDNWPDGNTKPEIKNLLIRELPTGCFTAELQMEDFIPAGEWQQAGLLLLKDSSLSSPSIRVSLAFNDFFGGYKKPAEVLVQAIASSGNDDKPEEFIHSPVLIIDSINGKVLFNNLKHTALRVEKRGKQYRFLYAGGQVDNSAFKQLISKDFVFEPRYIAIFAIKGRVPTTPVKSVTIKKFLLQSTSCE